VTLGDPKSHTTPIYALCVVYNIFVVGEHRDFKFGLQVDHSIASLLKCDISYFWCVAQFLCICRASCLSRFTVCAFIVCIVYVCYVLRVSAMQMIYNRLLRPTYLLCVAVDTVLRIVQRLHLFMEKIRLQPTVMATESYL